MQIVKKQMLPKLTQHIEKYCYRHMVTGAFWCLPCFGHCKCNRIGAISWMVCKLCATNILTQHDNFNLRVLAIYTIMSFCGNMYNIAIFGNQSNIAILEWLVQHATQWQIAIVWQSLLQALNCGLPCSKQCSNWVVLMKLAIDLLCAKECQLVFHAKDMPNHFVNKWLCLSNLNYIYTMCNLNLRFWVPLLLPRQG